jgi:hypothetical protein
MNCYAGLAKRLVKSCFPQVVPVPQLEPLDARKILKQEVKDINTNKACFALTDAEERVFKPEPITDEEAWEATLAWAEAKAQEREAAALKAVSETDTDESYDSDDSEVGVYIQPVRKSALFAGDDEASGSEDDEEFPLAAMVGLMRRGTIIEEKKAWNISDAAAAAAMWRDDAQATAEESVAIAKAMGKLAALAEATARVAALAEADADRMAATIIQAAERGRALRAWKAQFTDELAREMSHIWRTRYHTRMGMDAVEQQLAEQWMVSPKCVKAWILLGEQRSASAYLLHVSAVYT